MTEFTPYAPTEKQPGDIVIHGHAAYLVENDGHWTAIDGERESWAVAIERELQRTVMTDLLFLFGALILIVAGALIWSVFH
jgi:uncharacterized BrkB/YihY/UPF0761 family membrane protein